jgi:aerobic carbon-monoxide dehydrogenase medium subunit
MEYALKDFHWGKGIEVRQYLQPLTAREALEMLAEREGRALIIAGGTDVIPMLRQGGLQADALVDITRLPGMGDIEFQGDTICLGGLVTHARLAASALIREKAGLLAEAAGAVGSPQIRNVATVAGNLVSAQPAADVTLPLLALNAKVTLLSLSGEREVPLAEFFPSPGKPAIDCRREILTRVRFPALREDQGGCYLRLSLRKALSLPMLASAFVVTVDPGKKKIVDAAVSLGPVAPVPFRAAKTEATLRNAPISPKTLEGAARAAFAEANPRSSLLRGSTDYRKAMVKVFVRRGLSRALENAGAGLAEEA